jgi:outer membrane protein assembly factor BamA
VQPSFTSTTALLNLNYPGGNALGRHGIDLHTAYSRYHDHDEGLFDFGRFDLESQQRVRGILADHTLTFHQWFSSTGAEDIVPFYLQHTLGGAGSVRRFSEEILGSDGTKATLRGFRDLRFRGPHLLLLQAEYRVKIFGPIDMTLFVDSGMAAARRGQIGVGGLNTDGGFSLSLMTSDATALRIDVGTGGGEGTRVFFSVGPIFQR